MKQKILFLLVIFLLFSCSEKKDSHVSNNKTESKNSAKLSPNTLETKVFDFEKFQISKGQIGEIKIGMKIKDAEKFLNPLTKTKTEAYDFGFDGGGSAFIYSLQNQPILALVPKRDFDELLAIIAISKNLKTKNGLNPNSTVREIIAKYPDIKVNQDVMMDWEFMHDEKNNLQFVFETDENNQIGQYEEIETPAKPKRTNTKANWIEIR